MDAFIIKKGIDFEAFVQWEDNAGDLLTGVSAQAQIRQTPKADTVLAEFNSEAGYDGLIEFGTWTLEMNNGTSMTFNVRFSMTAAVTAELDWPVNAVIMDARAVDTQGRTWPLITEEELDPVGVVLKEASTRDE